MKHGHRLLVGALVTAVLAMALALPLEPYTVTAVRTYLARRNRDRR